MKEGCPSRELFYKALHLKNYLQCTINNYRKKRKNYKITKSSIKENSGFFGLSWALKTILVRRRTKTQNFLNKLHLIILEREILEKGGITLQICRRKPLKGVDFCEKNQR